MKFKVTTRIEGLNNDEVIECQSMMIKDGAYLFLNNDCWDEDIYENVIIALPVNRTIVRRIIETGEPGVKF